MKIPFWETKQQRLAVLLTAASFILVLVSITISNQFGVMITGIRLKGFEVGKVASRDLIADRDYVYTDADATEESIKKQIDETPPVFEISNEVTTEVLNNFFEFSRKLIDYKESGSDTAKNDLVSVMEGNFTDEEIEFIYNIADVYQLIQNSSEILEEMMVNGIVKIPVDITGKDFKSIKLWKWKGGQREYSIIDRDQIVTRAGVSSIIEEKLKLKKLSETDKNAVSLLTGRFIEENIFYDSIQSELQYEEIRNSVEPVTEIISAGDHIIKTGFIITEKDMNKAVALNSEIRGINYRQIGAVFIYLAVLYIFAALVLKPMLVANRRRFQYLYLILSFYLIFIVISSVFMQLSISDNLKYAIIIPTSLFCMLTSVLVKPRVGIQTAILFSLSVFMFTGITIYGFIYSLTSGVAASVLMRDAEKRIDLVKAAAGLSLINILIVSMTGLFQSFTFSVYLTNVMWAVLSALAYSIINLALIPVFEHLLNLPTVFRLMELSDMNAPIFKKMITMAPGTYGHSVAVANLAETACREIGANPLLARVGAYYHDIGKIDQPEYFIENQTQGNKHDDLKPSLSVAVIKSHVKVGIERAKEMGLPFEVIDIISQHHGSGLINYFYIEAMKKDGMNKKINPEDYSYTGIPPEEKEAAVVMLADTVEAASRVLKKPTISKLDKFIWKMIMEKVERGQMNNSALTMNDMLKIKQSFLNILSGHFHTRIEYPKLKSENK